MRERISESVRKRRCSVRYKKLKFIGAKKFHLSFDRREMEFCVSSRKNTKTSAAGGARSRRTCRTNRVHVCDGIVTRGSPLVRCGLQLLRRHSDVNPEKSVDSNLMSKSLQYTTPAGRLCDKRHHVSIARTGSIRAQAQGVAGAGCIGQLYSTLVSHVLVRPGAGRQDLGTPAERRVLSRQHSRDQVLWPRFSVCGADGCHD